MATHASSLVSACDYCLSIVCLYLLPFPAGFIYRISCVGHILIDSWHFMLMGKIHEMSEWTSNFQ